MPKLPFQAAAEGLPDISRRNVLTGLAAASIAASTSGALARLVGGAAPSRYQSRKFSGPGWYVFGEWNGPTPKRTMWAFQDEHCFIALSQGETLPVELYISHRSFDRACCAIVHEVPFGAAL